MASFEELDEWRRGPMSCVLPLVRPGAAPQSLGCGILFEIARSWVSFGGRGRAIKSSELLYLGLRGLIGDGLVEAWAGAGDDPRLRSKLTRVAGVELRTPDDASLELPASLVALQPGDPEDWYLGDGVRGSAFYGDAGRRFPRQGDDVWLSAIAPRSVSAAGWSGARLLGKARCVFSGGLAVLLSLTDGTDPAGYLGAGVFTQDAQPSLVGMVVEVERGALTCLHMGQLAHAIQAADGAPPPDSGHARGVPEGHQE